MPHARVPGLATPRAAFVRTAAPVAFDAPDGRGVSVFLALIVPGDADERHLELLAAVGERFADRRIMHGLKRARWPHEVLALLEA